MRHRRRYQPNTVRLVPPGASFGICPECGKHSYTSKQQAKRSARVLYPESRMRVYECGGMWHMTSQDAEATAGQRARAAERAAAEPGREAG